MASILIIDDSPTEVNYVRAILEGSGYEVAWENNARSGIEHAVKDLPDLILMDVVMPGMNGFQATRQLRRLVETKNIPIMMLTTKDQQTDKIWGLRNGANAYMTKPPEQHALIAEIQGLLSV
ncbi:response regulator [Suttonella sp. R2A3]|uniref:response regulator n=1 Tax=Suttonella sp. R2A3 TaxID=2908648 RepID=UPI001F425BB5|nr:response regulator [Suttonella sp. R2A3]UJF25298.1 response regulator [Suttonella sp. R2A3]